MAAIRTILCPTDFSEGARHAFDLAAAMAREHNAALIVLHAEPIRELVMIAGDPVAKLQPPEYATGIRESLARLQVPELRTPVEHWLVQGEPVNVIDWVARVTHCDLIIMGAHGTTSQGTEPRGDVAAHVVRKAPCPVITVDGPGLFTLQSGTTTRHIDTTADAGQEASEEIHCPALCAAHGSIALA
jgi:nucleotide-binding universal stress UspA family protein